MYKRVTGEEKMRTANILEIENKGEVWQYHRNKREIRAKNQKIKAKKGRVGEGEDKRKARMQKSRFSWGRWIRENYSLLKESTA